jgi:hypothetical protein
MSALVDASREVMRELEFQGRRAWVSLKNAAGLSSRTDRTFYVDSFARGLRAGKFPRTLGVLATGKNDGAGSQAQAAMSAIAFAEAFGLEYIHRPFAKVEHAEGEASSWAKRCEDHFNLGHGALTEAEAARARPIVPLEQYIRAPQDWRPDSVVAAQHFLHFCNQDSQAWERIVQRLRICYAANKPEAPTQPLTVALHLRRGDVTASDCKVAPNFTPNSVFVRTLTSIREALNARGLAHRIQLFSQGRPEMFADLRALGCELHLDTPALETHAALVDADVLIMSRGAFSYTAGVLNRGMVLYDPQKYRPLQDWIVRDQDGNFDAAAFDARLAALMMERAEVPPAEPEAELAAPRATARARSRP